MKRFALLILSLLYLSTSIGAGINLHYCMGKLVDSSLFELDAANCNKCGMEKGGRAEDDCCKDEHKKVKVQDEHKVSNISFIEVPPVFPALLPTLYELPDVLVTSYFLDFPVCHAPPRSSSNPDYILNCTFLI